MKKLSTLLTLLFTISIGSFAQVVDYYVPVGDLIGMTINSGDICFDAAEYKQSAAGNTWGFQWISTGSNLPSSVTVDFISVLEEAAGPYPTTLNGVSNVPVTATFSSCSYIGQLYNLDPSTYNFGGLNTFLMDYSAGSDQNQILPVISFYAHVSVDYTPAGCNDPDVPTLSTLPTTICEGSSATITVTGSLNDATEWYLYSGSCGGTFEQSTSTAAFTVSPGTTTTYYVRGEGGCVVPGSCGNITINVMPNADATITPAGPFCENDAPFTLTAVDGGGTWSGTGITNATTGEFDPAIAGCGTHTITYTIGGACGDTDAEPVVVYCLDDPSFNYSSTDYCANDPNQLPTISGTPGGTFTSTPPGLALTGSTGEVDVSASAPGSYVITYATSGACPDNSNVNFNITSLPNNGVTQAGAMLTADNASATYQWLDCDNSYAQIAGETNQSYTATANGNYAVAVTENGCTDTSACVNVTGIGIDEEFGSAISVYPNPAGNSVTVDLGATYVNARVAIQNELGQTVINQTVNGQHATLALDDLPTGVYLVELWANGQRAVHRLMKE